MMSSQEMLAAVLPTADIARITLESCHGGLKTTVDLNVKVFSAVSAGQAPFLMTQITSLYNYFKFVVIVSYDAQLTDDIIQQKVDILKNVNQLTGNEQQKLIVQQVQLDWQDIAKLVKPLETDETCYEAACTVAVQHVNISPEHVTCFIFGCLDWKSATEALMSSGDLLSDADWMLWNYVAEAVIVGGQIVSTAYVMAANGGTEAWLGPMWLDKTGKVPVWKGADGTELIPVPVINNKVVDFRQMAEIEKLTIDLTTYTNLLFAPDHQSWISKDNMEVPRTVAYFSDSFISIKPDNSRNLFFVVDFRKLLYECSPYGKLLGNMNNALVSEILKNSKIVSLRVLRDRRQIIDGAVNRLGGIGEASTRFLEAEEPSEVVAFSRDQQTSEEFINVQQTTGDSLQELDLSLGLGLRAFECHDASIQNITTGVYGYCIELIVEDGSFLYLLQKLAALLPLRAEIEQYWQDGMCYKNYNYDKDMFIDSFVKKWQQGEESLWFRATSAYLETLLFFWSLGASSSQIAQKALYNFVLSLLDPAIANPTSVSKFLDLLDRLINVLNKLLDLSEIDQCAFNTTGCSVNFYGTGTLKGNKGAAVRTHIALSYLSNVTTDTDVLMQQGGYEYLGNTSLEGKMTYVDFLVRIKEETLKYFSSEASDISLRAGDKIITAQDDARHMASSYLAPRAAIINGQRISFGVDAATVDHERNTQVALFALGGQNAKNSPGTPSIMPSGRKGSTQSQALEQIGDSFIAFSDIVATLGVGVGSGARPGGQNIQTQTQEDLLASRISSQQGGEGIIDPLPATKATGRNSVVHAAVIASTGEAANPNSALYGIVGKYINDIVLPRDAKGTETISGGRNLGTFTHSKQIPQVCYDVNAPRGLIATLRQTGKEDKEISRIVRTLPNQIKSLLLASVHSKAVRSPLGVDGVPVIAPTTAATYKFWFGALQKLEILTTFEGASKYFPGYQIKLPIWNLVTTSMLEELAAGTYLCRLKDYDSKTAGTVGLGNVAMPIYDQFFLLIKGTVAEPKTAKVKTQMDVFKTWAQQKSKQQGLLGNTTLKLFTTLPVLQEGKL
jgi:hypothetical protein